MIIKVSNKNELKIAAGVRDSLRAANQEVYVVPEFDEITIFVTLHENDMEIGNNRLVVLVSGCEDDAILDGIYGFNNCLEAYTYAKELAEHCGYIKEMVWGDVSDDSMNIDKEKLANTTGFC